MRANRSTLAKLCLLAALAVPVQRSASAAEANRAAQLVATGNAELIAQAEAPEFSPPASLDAGTSLLIDGSSSMQALNEALTAQFQERYSDAEVEASSSSTDEALERLQSGEINLAAIGRPLTQAEQDAGLVAVPVAREKIAIFVGPDNGFDGDLTFEQFGQIFRGEITDWSEVGGEPGPIRFVDRPDSSDTRTAFNAYPTFQQAAFETGATADPVAVDETEAVVEQLGRDGIGYAIANQVLGNDAVKIVPMHQTLPDDPAYPYSQPRSYVYFGETTPAIEGFLGVATGVEGQEVVDEVRETEGAAVAQLEGAAPEATNGELTARTNESNVAIIEDASGNLVAGPLAAAGGAVTALAFSPDGETLATGTNTGKVRYWNTEGEPQSEVFDPGNGNAISALNFEENDKLEVGVANDGGRRGLWGLNGLPYGEEAAAGTVITTETDAAGVPWWLWLIPLLGLLGAGLWWLLGRDRQTTTPEPRRQTSPTATVPPPVTDPDSDREVSNRAQTVIKTDRVTDESRAVTPSAELPVAPPIPDVPTTPQAEVGVNDPDLPEFESTDLEEPEIDDRNLDLRTAGLAGGAAVLGGAALAGALDTEDDDNDEAWDDNLDLTLDDPDAGTATADLLLARPDAEITDGGTATEPVGTNNLDDIEPTRDTVIAEADDVPDIEPDSQTIIGDSAVIFRGAAAENESAAAAVPDSTDEPAPVVNPASLGGTSSSASSASTEDAGRDIDSFFSAKSNSPQVEPESREDTLEAGLSPVLEDSVQESPVLDSTVILGSAAAGIAGGTINTIPLRSKTEQDAPPSRSYTVEELASVDDDLPELPEGYGDSRIVLLPRDPKWAYAYWDISNEHKDELRRQGGQQLALRLYDVTDIDQNHQTPHSMQQQDCDEMARSWYLEIPTSDRDYTAEIGYVTGDGNWLMLARSAPIRVPPIYPSDWANDQFVTIGFDDALAGRTYGDLGRAPSTLDNGSPVEDLPPIYNELFAMTQGQNALRVAGSLFGSMHQVAPGALSLSGNLSGLNMSGLNVSGLNMSGVGMDRKRNFWLVADAELIVYGATEPNATLTIGDRVVPLSPEGTFRFHVHFPDGKIDYPIRAVAADGEQSRSITMKFDRGTPERNTNTKDEAQDEWF